MLDLWALGRLPGAADENFEVFTRALVSRRWGGAGVLRERRNQPGVEFFLRLTQACDLGDPPRVYGWSCKYFELNNRNEFSAGQRAQIEDSLAKARRHVDGLTDFVLCLPERPAKRDQDWYFELESGEVDLHLWASEDFEARLAGHDELRSTFFGELVLTDDVLAAAHERAVKPIEARWVRALHTRTHVESDLDVALLRGGAFDLLDRAAVEMSRASGQLRAAVGDINNVALQEAVRTFADDLESFVTQLQEISTAARSGHPLEARDLISDRQLPSTTPRGLLRIVRALRNERHPVALVASGLAAAIRDAARWLSGAAEVIAASSVAVVGAAGHGKTHLGAQLTAPSEVPAGVFIQGAKLRAGDTLDDLARRVVGIRVDRFEDLLAALDAAGARSGYRVPLVIDGLNESERPNGWRTLLAELVPALPNYPHVLVVVTLRERLAETAIPNEATRLDLEWSRHEVDDIVEAYFEHYRIDPAGAWLPWQMFHNPLFVRMYCEAANPDRAEGVGAEVLPTSLVGAFERYRDGVASRLALDPARKPIPAHEIKRRLASVARALMESDSRRLPSEQARQILDGNEDDWDESLFRRLEEEGVLLREEVDGGDDTATGIVFDRFAGYLMADSILAQVRYDEAAAQLSSENLWQQLLGEDANPFGEDMTVGLVGLVPRRFGGHHLWRFAPEANAAWVLLQEFNTESDLLDASTVDALAELAAATPLRTRRSYGSRHPFDRLWEICNAPGHRLNARFLDRVLRSLTVAERDLRWTEWARVRAADELVAELDNAAQTWVDSYAREERDDLYAHAIAWLLTSTDESLRDRATRALVMFGRPDPRRLFRLASYMITANDPYIEERVIAAAFGAASAHQMPDPGGPFVPALADWLAVLAQRYLSGGNAPTSHELIRTYVRSTFELAAILHREAVPEGVDPLDLQFSAPSTPVPMREDDPNADECSRSIRMDFENYVIGAAYIDRSNYDPNHEAFKTGRGQVMRRIWDLGWRAEHFDGIDREIADDRYRPARAAAKVERYGKKYSWIAYYELVGRLVDAGDQVGRWVGAGRNVHTDIDPTFPAEPPELVVELPDWAPTADLDDEAWIRAGEVVVPADLWSPVTLNEVDGPWLLVEGFLEHRRGGRKVFGFFRTVLVEVEDLSAAETLVVGRPDLGSDFLPRLAQVHDLMAGELPWSPRFENSPDDTDEPALQENWKERGIPIEQMAVELEVGDRGSTTALQRSYEVPSHRFAAQFDLRQMPGTLNLVGLDGSPATIACRAEGQWRGSLLYIRRDLVAEFAGDRRVMRVAWGERSVTVDWNHVPEWLAQANRTLANQWRKIEILD
jgi:hypothetical protein